MTDAHAGLVLGLTQAALTIAIVADRWVHRVTGGKSLEARVADLETGLTAYREAMKLTLDDWHRKASDFESVQQISVGKIEIRLASIDEHLRNTDLNVAKLERRRGNG